MTNAADCEFPHPHPEHPCGRRVIDGLRDLIAETIYRRYNGQTWTDLDLADALLADPTLAAIIDLAALFPQTMAGRVFEIAPEVRALLAAWRAER